MKKFLLLCLVLQASFSYAADIQGTYDCKGSDPYLKQDYKGNVVITKSGNVYQLEMNYDTGEKSVGTGLMDKNVMSVAFQDKSNPSDIGLQSYTFSGKSMEGKWVYLGKNLLGNEKCTLSKA